MRAGVMFMPDNPDTTMRLGLNTDVQNEGKGHLPSSVHVPYTQHLVCRSWRLGTSPLYNRKAEMSSLGVRSGSYKPQYPRLISFHCSGPPWDGLISEPDTSLLFFLSLTAKPPLLWESINLPVKGQSWRLNDRVVQWTLQSQLPTR